MLTKAQKEIQVQVLHDKFERANSVVAVDYRGLTVDDANALRASLGKTGEGQIEYNVAKNTLARRAVVGTPTEGLTEFLVGPTALAFSFDEPSALAKALVDFSKDNEKFEIKGGVVDGELADLAMIKSLAALPSRFELQGMLAGTLQAPMRNLAGTLNSLLGYLRNALDARQKQLES